ncbi:MAG: hypothetical protein ACNA7G_04795 [Methylobacter sp.]
MKEEYNFSNAEQGEFYVPIENIQLPIIYQEIEQACGILQASHGLTLEQMDEVIRKRGGEVHDCR